jgi:hypothetical protein
MALTKDDICEMRLNIEGDAASLNYMLNVPGNGTSNIFNNGMSPEYIEDPYIRLQRFGANLSFNPVDINSKLGGVYNQLSCDTYVKNTRDPFFDDYYLRNNYSTIKKAITDQPRATNPAWELRGLEQNRWAYLPNNPQLHTEKLFSNNNNSRMDEKDKYNSQCKS